MNLQYLYFYLGASLDTLKFEEYLTSISGSWGLEDLDILPDGVLTDDIMARDRFHYFPPFPKILVGSPYFIIPCLPSSVGPKVIFLIKGLLLVSQIWHITVQLMLSLRYSKLIY